MNIQTGTNARGLSVATRGLLYCCGAVMLFAGTGCTSHFIDRRNPSDLRVVSYNVMFDSIFPDQNPAQAEKFVRVIRALDPDILNLQEIKRPEEDVLTLMNQVSPLGGSKSWHVHQGRNNVIVSKYPLTEKATDTIPAGQRGQAIALVDLPDDRYQIDLYIMNNHYKCCGDSGGPEDQKRQKQSDAIVNWICDARTTGGKIDLPSNTPIIVCGDLNLVGGLQPLNTLLNGNIIDSETFGTGCLPDWDNSELTDACPLHNATGPDTYTWRNDHSEYDPGQLDFVIYTDSCLEAVYSYVLNTAEVSPNQLSAKGLQMYDVTIDQNGEHFDHLPVIVDFQVK